MVHLSKGPAELLECQCVQHYRVSFLQMIEKHYDMRQIWIVFYPQSLSPRDRTVLGSVERLTVIPTLHTYQPFTPGIAVPVSFSLEAPCSSTSVLHPVEHLILQKSVLQLRW